MNLKQLLKNIRRRVRPRRWYGLNGLDTKLVQYMPGDGGIFVEAGANNGVNQSNTLHLERFRGWSGLLIEPIPELYEQCKRNRPNCRVEQAALVPFASATKTVTMQYCGLMSLVAGAMQSEEADEQHVSRGAELQGIQPYQVQVPAKPLSDILDAHDIKHIDLLCLDVEGYEASALRGLDLDRHHPKFMLIEARFREEIDELLLDRYEAIAQLSHHDVLYRLNV